MNYIFISSILLIAFGSNLYSTQFEIIDNDGYHISEAVIYLVSSNNTKVSGISKKSGFAYIKPVDDQIVTVLCAAKAVEGFIGNNINPNLELVIKMNKLPNGGSVLFSEGSGEIPSIIGSLNPILDTLNRKYIYGRDISINNGQQQPVNFEINKFFKIEDKKRNVCDINISHISGKIFLLNYKK